MDLDIAGRVALVVGGSKGMGLAICEHLVRDGCRVVVVARDQDGIDAALAQLRTLGGAEAVGVSADITTPGGPGKAMGAARAAFGAPDILIFNIEMGYRLSLETATPEDFQRGHNALVMSFLAMVREVAPAMKERRWGRILTISSAAVKQTGMGGMSLIVDVTYRHAGAAVSKVISNELAPYGVTVNTVGPGSVGTKTHEAMFRQVAQEQGVTYEQMIKTLEARVPLGRLGKPEEFGAVCAFLCSERAGFVNGQTLLVDGGRYQGF